MTATDAVTVLYSQQIDGDFANPVTNSGAGALTGTNTRQFLFKLSCLCEVIDKMVCFSRTLNCVIIQKAASTCGTIDFNPAAVASP